jgi:hypothetical protein
MGQPKWAAMDAAVSWSVRIGTKVLLWKLIVRPVAAEKLSKTHLRLATC